jgi:primosomal protein N' (replication factor Y)
MCHKCGERRSAEEMCVNCGGWRLTPLGIGIDRVAEELRNNFPEIEVYKIDADATKTPKQLNDALQKFRARPGSVLLGTELALLHLGGKVDHVAVASLDSLFTLPDFRIQEKVMYTLIRLRSEASRSILVQTRRPEEKVFEYGLKGNLSDFYRATLSERKQFRYPPFTVLIKLTIEGKKEAISGLMAKVQETLMPFEIDVFPAFTSTVKGNSVIHGLLVIETHAWPDPVLISKLRSLPPSVFIKVNPETLL